MSDAEDENLTLDDGEDDSVVANAILSQPGEFPFQGWARVGLLGKVSFETSEYSTSLGFG